jgi:hypothetical protein
VSSSGDPLSSEARLTDIASSSESVRVIVASEASITIEMG